MNYVIMTRQKKDVLRKCFFINVNIFEENWIFLHLLKKFLTEIFISCAFKTFVQLILALGFQLCWRNNSLVGISLGIL